MMFLTILANFPLLFSLMLRLIMNMLIWNCRGANNPNFCINVSDMIHRHYPIIMIITKTKLSGDRAKRIIDRLLLDGVIVANSFGRFGGLWLLWGID